MIQKNRQILVIDDNQTIHEDFRKILCSNNATAAALDEADALLFGGNSAPGVNVRFELESAFQGQEALTLVEKHLKTGRRYAMAFVDVRMPPGWDGIETVARIWEVDPEIQIVICTAFSEYSWEDMLAKLGRNDKLLILKKPFDNIEVQQLAHALTEKWHLLQETKSQLTTLEERVQQRTQQLLTTNGKLEQEVAERMKTETALRESQQTVLRQERLASVGQLSAGIAHEFNNILTVIQGHASLVLESGNHDEITEASLHHIAESAERAATLTRQMLAFGRKQLIRHQSFDIAEMIHRMGEMLERIVCENIKFNCTSQSPVPHIWADPGMMEQIIMNLVLNARDAMPKGGEITLSVTSMEITSEMTARLQNGHGAERREGRFICLAVSDTGCGMSEETLKHVFEPFFTTKDVGKGTGLGLATVYGIVQQHNGWIEVSSLPEKGSAFRIYLPQAQPNSRVTPTSEQTAPKALQQKNRILVVEDQVALRNLVRTVLTRHGFHVMEAATGREALLAWEHRASEIDLLFTDLMMPDGVLGHELAEKMKAANPNLRVLFTSGYSEDVLENSPASERIQLLQKPYKPDELVQIIQSSLHTAS